MIRSKSIRILVGLSCNLFFSLTIVFLNKWLYSIDKFPNITLTCLHFTTTAIILYLLNISNIFKRKHVQLKHVLPLSLTFCGFVVFTNLSLQNNTVGTYQLAKTLTTPVIMAIQIKFYDKSFCNKIKLTMLPIITGVFINSYYDLEFNFYGIIFAICGVFVTSFYQILVGSKQKQLGISSLQLLFYQAPISAFILGILILFLEPPWQSGNLLSFNWTLSSSLLVLSSCLTAFFVNITIYWVIGNTSAVTYNMFGHFKFVATLVGGYLIFKNDISNRQILGIILTCIGIGLYTKLKLSQNDDKKLPRYKKVKNKRFVGKMQKI